MLSNDLETRVTWWMFIAAMLFFLLIRNIYLIVYRLYLSPLSKFPGPKIAAATHWYEFYYNWWHEGKYIYEIEKMHASHGPIVRVNPDLLSIHDPEAYNEIYVTESKRKTENYSHFGQGIGFDGSHFLTTDHDLHRRRRRPLEPFFSRSGTLRLKSILGDTMAKLETRLRAEKGTGRVLRLDHVFFAMSGDVVGKLCWSTKEELLDDPKFAPEWYNLVHSIIKTIYLFQGFPWLARVMNGLPKSLRDWLAPEARVFEDFNALTLESLALAKKRKSEQRNVIDVERWEHGCLFDWIINSDLPASELDDMRLANEAQVIQSAGSTSTARTMTHIVYHVLSKPQIRQRLTAELSGVMAAWPDRVPSWVELEGLPYLQACLKEGLSYATMHPLPRVAPTTQIQYKQWTIPAGTAVGMSAYLMHTDPGVYPNPSEFRPERWLGDITPAMLRNFVPFTRGSRNCLGQNLAQSELSLALAVLLRPGAPRLVLYDTDETDTNHVHDFIVPLPSLKTKGVRVTVE